MTHHHSTRRRWGRLVAAVIVVGGLAAGGALIVRHRSKSAGTTTTTPIFKTATVEQGNLDTTERIDGSLELSDVTSVLHRIEGQASSSIGTTGSSGSSSGGGVAPSPAVSSAAVRSAAAVGCGTGPGSSVPTGSTQPGTTSPGTSVPDTSLPGSTTTSTTPPTTDPGSTQPGTTTPGTTMPGTTTPNGPDTTTPCTTVPSGGGGSIPGGTGGSIGGSIGGTTGGTSGSTRVTQVVTSVIGQGSTVDIGTVLYSVESSPVVAMGGALPAWRTMNTSSSDGTDIGQLELNLAAMGYDPDHTMTIDTTFDSDTKAVVKAWQQGYGMEVTGEVTLGSVVFVSAGATVAGVDVGVGDAVGDGDTVLSLSTSSQQVVIDVPDGAAQYLVPGLAVQAAGADATVSLLRSVERDGSAVVQAVIVPVAPIEHASNGATVKVTIAITNLADVLIVPSEALVSRLDGSYAVQVQAADGTTSFVTVELLGVSGAKAGVRGDGLTAGATVLQPA